jgi:hypothetical protein
VRSCGDEGDGGKGSLVVNCKMWILSLNGFFSNNFRFVRIVWIQISSEFD